jgi:hypothetical protein
MGLHRPSGLAEGEAKGVEERGAVESEETAGRRRGTEDPGVAGRKNVMRLRAAAPIVADTSTPDTIARMRSRPVMPP